MYYGCVNRVVDIVSCVSFSRNAALELALITQKFIVA